MASSNGLKLVLRVPKDRDNKHSVGTSSENNTNDDTASCSRSSTIQNDDNDNDEDDDVILGDCTSAQAPAKKAPHDNNDNEEEPDEEEGLLEESTANNNNNNNNKSNDNNNNKSNKNNDNVVNVNDNDNDQEEEEDDNEDREGGDDQDSSDNSDSFLVALVGGDIRSAASSTADENSVSNFSATEHNQETPSNLSSSLDPFSNNSTNHSAPNSGVKKRRKRKRFKFTMPTQRTPAASKSKRKLEDEIHPEKDIVKKKPAVEETVPSEKDSIEDDPAIVNSIAKPPERPPLHLLLNYLLNYVEKKDPENYFMHPVSDDIAPNYSSFVKNPMDFFTMRNKLENNSYATLEQFKADLELIYKNAKVYNEPGSIFYLAAQKLKSVVEFLFSREKFVHIFKTQSFMSKIPTYQLKSFISPTKSSKDSKKCKLPNYACIVDDMSAEDVLVQANLAAAMARQKLTARRPKCKVAYINSSGSKKDGTYTLKILTPEDLLDEKDKFSAASSFDDEGKKFCLADLLPKLKEGTPGLTKPEPKPWNVAIPCSPLDYGSFASFAPYFDSTWSTLSKDESKLLLAAVNEDKTCVDYVDSLRNFSRNSGDYTIKLVDGMLDILTNGEYSKALKANNEEYVENEHIEQFEENHDTSIAIGADHLNIDASLQSKADQLLTQNSTLLSELQKIQHERLSQPPPFVLTDAAGPSRQEVEVAEKVVNNLQSLVSQAEPGDLAPAKSIRSIMGIAELHDKDDTNDSEEYDMEVFKEFFQV